MSSLSQPRSAYVHVPFCRHRCGYCNFSVVAGRDDLIERYLNAVDLDLQRAATQDGAPVPLDTLFIGGGTPTHFDTDRLQQFLQILKRRFELSDSTEWSMEANPEDISPEKLSLLSQYGVNRISLGVQSFNDSKLKTLERSHSGLMAQDVVRQTASVIPNVSIDLIFGAPGESPADWADDLQTTVELPVKHVSTYALTFEKGTSFWTREQRGDLQPVNESDEIQMYDDAREMFAAAALQHYEISSFAREGYRCRHNMAYWRGDPWLAAGPGAAAYLDGRRTLNHRSTTTYLKRIESGQSPIAETEEIPPEESAREKAAFGVRMIEGVDLEVIHRQTGVDIALLCEKEVRELADQRLIDRLGSKIRLTSRGVHFADTVAREFFGDG